MTKIVVQRFLNLGEDTSRQALVVKGKSLESLEKLSRWMILKQENRNYLPLPLAFHFCEDAEALLTAKNSVTVVAHVLRNLFETDLEGKQHTAPEAEAHARAMYESVDPKQIRLGLLLGRDIGLLAGSGGPSIKEISSFGISEHIIEMNPDNVWDDYVNRQVRWIQTQEEGTLNASIPKISPAPANTDATGKYGGWEIVRQISGTTGQSDVLLARSPQRATELAEAAKTIQRYAGGISLDQAPAFAAAILQSARPDSTSELGALKIFKTRGSDAEAEQEVLNRLKTEIRVLEQANPGLLRLLASSETGRWIITQYHQHGTLENHPLRYRGKAALALRAVRPLIQAVATLHTQGIAHRDIKPANVFVGNDGELILGDFGIAYVPDQPDRVTRTNERVGPFDYMPPWADLGERLEKVDLNFDVYMLGKLLWCMVAGRARLPRERFQEPGFNLTQTFPDDPDMNIINSILAKCVVFEAKDCLAAATDLLLVVDTYLRVIDRGGHLLGEKIPRPCRVCGMGHYQMKLLHQNSPAVGLRFWRIGTGDISAFPVRVLVCDNCSHVEFFASS